MSASDKAVTFDVRAFDAGTELFLVDGNFALAGRGIGKATFAVPPGVYKLKARTGKTAVDQMIVVRPGMPPVTLGPIAFPSPIPREHTAAPEQNAGSGSAIVIVLREPAPGLRLRSLDGTTVAQIDGKALHVTVDPGPYRLSVGGHELTVMACPGLETQIYANGSDLVNAAVTIRVGFAADDPDLRLEEIARIALQDWRSVLSAEMRERILAPDASPMLALLGAHLLIREAKVAKAANEDAPPERQKPLVDHRADVAKIVANLRRKLGRHPDVEAIAIGAGVGDPGYIFDAPPMLRPGWRRLLKASAEEPHLVPPDSFAARAAERLWGDGPWLLYFDPDAEDPVDRAALWQATAREALAQLTAPPRVELPPPGFLRGMFRKVKSLFIRRARRAFPDLRVALQRTETTPIDLATLKTRLDDKARRTLVKRLGIPMSKIDAFLERV